MNNKYDYPLGLPYLLCAVPFLGYTWTELRKWRYPVLAFFTVLYWATWWMGSQQSRFFYIPLVAMIILVCSRIKATRFFGGGFDCFFNV